MPEKRDLDGRLAAILDESAARVVGLLRSGLTDRPFGSLTVTWTWKGGVLTKETTLQGEEKLLLPSRQD